MKRTVDGKRQDDRVGEDDLVAVEVVDDLLDVLSDLGPLVADEVAGLVAGDPGDVGDLQDLRPRSGRRVQRRIRAARGTALGARGSGSRARPRHDASPALAVVEELPRTVPARMRCRRLGTRAADELCDSDGSCRGASRMKPTYLVVGTVGSRVVRASAGC